MQFSCIKIICIHSMQLRPGKKPILMTFLISAMRQSKLQINEKFLNQRDYAFESEDYWQVVADCNVPSQLF